MMNSSKTYYVSSIHGRDDYDGLTEHTPFRSLHQINRLSLNPGDQVLIECNSIFENEYLHLTSQGTSEAPIVITSYGEGLMPAIHTNGNGLWYQDYGNALDSSTHIRTGYVSSAILLYDAQYIEISKLEVTNSSTYLLQEEYSAPHKMDRSGVAVVAQNHGTLHHIHIKNLCIHDVHGNVYNKHMNNGGIYATVLKPLNEELTGIPRFNDFLVEDCYLHKVSRWGIAIGYTYLHDKFRESELADELFLQYGHENIHIRNNYVKAAGGDGITPMYALRPIVEHNVADGVACEMNDAIYQFPENRMGKVAAGIWPWKCKDALFRYNEVVDTRLNQDGMAYDADSGDGTIYEYNYSRLNEGGCVMFCLEQSIHNQFCHNISYDDLGGTISPAQNPDAYLAHNHFFIRKGVPFIRKHMDGGNFIEENNQLITIEKNKRK
ncbi:MAG: polyhydroxyalkanoate depolymerase [Vallitaleaceae bacterium]|nr:polyhydroxyalkanoate depolymerase [Vallitaleaceae bacterium]